MSLRDAPIKLLHHTAKRQRSESCNTRHGPACSTKRTRDNPGTEVTAREGSGLENDGAMQGVTTGVPGLGVGGAQRVTGAESQEAVANQGPAYALDQDRPSPSQNAGGGEAPQESEIAPGNPYDLAMADGWTARNNCLF